MGEREGYNTKAFGDSSEDRILSGVGFMRNPARSVRPDGISVNGDLDPRASFECKSGRRDTGVVVVDQFGYEFNAHTDHNVVPGTRIKPSRSLADLRADWPDIDILRDGVSDQVAYYYALIGRTDNLTGRDVRRPFASVRLTYGNTWMVPHQFALASYVAQRTITTAKERGVTPDSLLPQVMAEMKDFLFWKVTGEGQPPKGWEPYRLNDDGSVYINPKTGKPVRSPQTWKSLSGRNIDHVFDRDEASIKRFSAVKDRLMRTLLGREIEAYHRIEMPGPNGSRVRVLARPEHWDLFNRQVREVVESRNPVLEGIIEDRADASKPGGILSRVRQRTIVDKDLFGDVIRKRKVVDTSRITAASFKRLKRLEKWLAPGERPHGEAYVEQRRRELAAQDPPF